MKTTVSKGIVIWRIKRGLVTASKPISACSIRFLAHAATLIKKIPESSLWNILESFFYSCDGEIACNSMVKDNLIETNRTFSKETTKMNPCKS